MKPTTTTRRMASTSCSKIRRLLNRRNWEQCFQYLETINGQLELTHPAEEEDKDGDEEDDCNDASHNEEPLLATAIRLGAPLRVFEALLERYDPSTLQKYNRTRGEFTLTLLSMAITSRRSGCSPEVILALMEADPDSVRVPVGKFHRYPLHMICSTRPYHVELVKKILKAFPEAAQYPDQCGNLPLHLLFGTPTRPRQRFHVEGIRAVWEAYPAGMEKCNHAGQFPLHLACAREAAAASGIVSDILEAYPHAAAYKLNDHARRLSGYHPLHLLCANSWLVSVDKKQKVGGQAQLLRQVLTAFPQAAAIPLPCGQYPLHLVLSTWHTLLRIGVLNQSRYSQNAPPSEEAIREEQHVADILSQLLEAYPEAARIPMSPNGQLPAIFMFFSAFFKAGPKSAVLRTLLAAAPEAIFRRNSSGNCILERICLNNAPSTVGDYFVTFFGTPTMELKKASPKKTFTEEDSALPLLTKGKNEDTLHCCSRGGRGGGEKKNGECEGLPSKLPFPMHDACFNMVRMVQVLEEIHNLYPHCAATCDGSGNLPLHIFCQECHVSRYRSETIHSLSRKSLPLVSSLIMLERLISWNGQALHTPDGSGDLPLVAAFRALSERHQHVPTDVLYILLRENPAALVQSAHKQAHQKKQADWKR